MAHGLKTGYTHSKGPESTWFSTQKGLDSIMDKGDLGTISTFLLMSKWVSSKAFLAFLVY